MRETYVRDSSVHRVGVGLDSGNGSCADARNLLPHVHGEHVLEHGAGEGDTKDSSDEREERHGTGTDSDQMRLLVAREVHEVDCQHEYRQETELRVWETHKTYCTAMIVF